MKRKQIAENTILPDLDNNLGRGAPGDREERLRQRTENRDRAAQDLDREDAEIQDRGVAGQAAGQKRPRTKGTERSKSR